MFFRHSAILSTVVKNITYKFHKKIKALSLSKLVLIRYCMQREDLDTSPINSCFESIDCMCFSITKFKPKNCLAHTFFQPVR